VKKIKGVFCFKVKKDGQEGVWVVDAKNGNGSVKFGVERKCSLYYIGFEINLSLFL